MSAIAPINPLTSPRTHEQVQKTWDLTSTEEQALLLKILRNIIENPNEPKYQHMSVERVTPKLGVAVSLLPVIGFENDGKGSLVLSRDANRVEATLDLLETRLGLRREQQKSQMAAKRAELEAEDLKRQVQQRLAARPRRPSYSAPSMPADSPVTKLWIMQELQASWQEGKFPAQDPMFILWDARNWTPSRAEAVQVLQGTLQEIINQPNAVIKKKGLFAKLNEAPGAIDLLLSCGSIVTEHFISMPPGASIDRLKQVQAELTRRVMTEPNQPSMTFNQQELSSHVQELTQKLGEPHRIEWTVLGWSAKEPSENRQWESHPALTDSEGRKWKGYAKKFSKDRVGIFLQCTEGKAVPCVVTMKASVLHRSTHYPVTLPDAASRMTISCELNDKERRFGYPIFTTNSELEMNGAFDPLEDAITFRVDFAVRSGPMTPRRRPVLPPVPVSAPTRGADAPKTSHLHDRKPSSSAPLSRSRPSSPTDTQKNKKHNEHHEASSHKMDLVEKMLKMQVKGEDEKEPSHLCARKRSIPDANKIDEMMNLGEKPQGIAGGAKPERFHKHEKPVSFDQITQPEIAQQHQTNAGVGIVVNQARGNLAEHFHHHDYRRNPRVLDSIMSELPL